MNWNWELGKIESAHSLPNHQNLKVKLVISANLQNEREHLFGREAAGDGKNGEELLSAPIRMAILVDRDKVRENL